jgi:hypothetical protein
MDNRIPETVSQVNHYAYGDFKNRLQVNITDEPDEIDSLITCIVMMGEDLSGRVAPKDFTRTLYEHFTDPVLILGPGSHITEFNRAGRSLLSSSKRIPTPGSLNSLELSGGRPLYDVLWPRLWSEGRVFVSGAMLYLPSGRGLLADIDAKRIASFDEAEWETLVLIRPLHIAGRLQNSSVSPAKMPRLNEKELKIIRLVAKDLKREAIVKELSIPPKRYDNLIQGIHRKCKVHTSAGLLRKALDWGIVDY